MNRTSTRKWRKPTAILGAAMLTAALALPAAAAPVHTSASYGASTSASSSVEKKLVNVAGFKDASNVKAFYANLQRAVAKGDKAAVAARVHYPLSVYLDTDDDKPAAKTVIKTKAQFLNKYNQIFTEDVRESLAETSFAELFVNQDGASIDDGHIWFTPSKSGMPGISTVNVDD
ncbi:hypothetical protein QWJ34_01430 [Saccharibacillus sp. CPCC 101409]|uniref:hypothetical protein n=1 Tax=Saccharibacillus sp. CPCC 101409 TaxID=3058041 RepID=UPI002672D225|nr:hypothetical protein [Saccharibacillus sp. CPCC 101409]MDO3408422.1 hypothetical protein [Saccharibacillus sp. CPCC 101409]